MSLALPKMFGMSGSSSAIPFKSLVGWYKFENNLTDDCTDFTPQDGVQGYGDGIEYTTRSPGIYGITNTHTGTVNLGTASKWDDLSGSGKAFTLIFIGLSVDQNNLHTYQHLFGHYQASSPFPGFGLAITSSGSNLMSYYDSAVGWSSTGITVDTTPCSFGIAHTSADNTGYYFKNKAYTDFTMTFPPAKGAGVNTTVFTRSDNNTSYTIDCTCGELLIFNAKLSKEVIDAIIDEREAA